MKKGTYVTLQSWMREGLQLSGNDLLVYAIIYGFSQDGESAFCGIKSYFADWCGITERAAQFILADLSKGGTDSKGESRPYITRVSIGTGRGSYTEYRAVPAVAELAQKGEKFSYLKRAKKEAKKGEINDKKGRKKKQETSLYIIKYINNYCFLSQPKRAEEEQKQVFIFFFFRNAANPAAEVQSFYRYNELAGWKDGKGRLFDTFEKRLLLADGWQFKTGDNRVNSAFLDCWRIIYGEALRRCDPFADKLIDERIRVESNKTEVVLFVTPEIKEWLEARYKERGLICSTLWNFVNHPQRRQLKYNFLIL